MRRFFVIYRESELKNHNLHSFKKLQCIKNYSLKNKGENGYFSSKSNRNEGKKVWMRRKKNNTQQVEYQEKK